MSKKQWIWLIAALVLFVAIGAYTAWQTNHAADQAMNMLGTFQSAFSAGAEAFPNEEFVARVDIDGTITNADQIALSSGNTVDGAYTMDYIDRLIDCPQNVGILLYVNSSGGDVDMGDSIYLKLMDYKNETGRPIYAYFDNTACSGAYYISMAADEIYANRNC